jgi:hypothetical protein
MKRIANWSDSVCKYELVLLAEKPATAKATTIIIKYLIIQSTYKAKYLGSGFFFCCILAHLHKYSLFCKRESHLSSTLIALKRNKPILR